MKDQKVDQLQSLGTLAAATPPKSKSKKKKNKLNQFIKKKGETKKSIEERSKIARGGRGEDPYHFDPHSECTSELIHPHSRLQDNLIAHYPFDFVSSRAIPDIFGNKSDSHGQEGTKHYR